jgi:hypothetical protein
MLKVHLVGSVPLSSAAEVFEAAATSLGTCAHRLPDGETGDRKNWINFQYGVMAEVPQLEFAGEPVDPKALAQEGSGAGADYVMPTPFRLKPGTDSESLTFGPLGYAQNAIESYSAFAQLKSASKIAPDVRFQVCLPTPLAPVALFVVPDDLGAVLPAYAKALIGELGQILQQIPHDQLAVQWDVAAEFGLWEGLFPAPPGDWKAMVLDQLAQVGDAVPPDVELGYHLCYGDRGHKHFVEPKDAANLVEVANGIAARVNRPINFLHLPVPRDRTDLAYFQPLAGLVLAPETELYLGLIHHTDGLDGTLERIKVARQVVPEFGIATECGLGRRDPATIGDLLKVHAAAARAA